MEKEIVNFLIRCDKDLNMMNIYWNNPIHLISPYQRNILDLLVENEGRRLRETIEKAINSGRLFFCEKSFELRNSNTEILICVMMLKSGVLVFGLDADLLDDRQFDSFISEAIFKFMNVIKSSDCEVLADGQETIKLQFEHIQKLNNQLLNMQRQIKKGNAELKRLNRDLNNRLVKDSLTGLVSRYQYREEVEFKIKSAPYDLGVFIFIDIDNFKRINDNHGHGVGDIYLKKFASLLKGLEFSNAVYMRIAGDEFGIYIHGYHRFGESEAYEIWCKIRDKVAKKPIEIDGLSLGVSCSVGMSVYGVHAKDIYSLIEYADFAMYEAKNSGKNSYRFFMMEKYMKSKEIDL